MLMKFSSALIATITVAVVIVAGSAFAQTATQPEYISPAGVKFYAQKDEKNAVAEAETKLATDPRNVDLIFALGRAQASVWQYREAIATYTRGIEIAPNNALLYRHRGHRFITLRQFDKAINDLERAAKLKADDFDIWYHLGLAHYLKGDFKKAAGVYEKCRRVAQTDDSVIAVSDWLYMAYRRLNNVYEAERVLSRITLNMKVEENKSYYDRLLLYKGYKKESDIAPDNLSDLELATVGYGIGNWYLYSDNPAKAQEWFHRITRGNYWPAFGFIAAEAELARRK
jgi:tetratricopeptide (TPR) repeat protein